jgi:Competence protein J (ComJ)
MNTKTYLSPRLDFSYHQFMVYDQSVRLPGCDWTDERVAQGFVRRESTVSFGTLLDFGFAYVAVASAYESREEYERVIAVPFLVMSGKVNVEGPEHTVDIERSIALAPGNYRLVAAQRVIRDEEEADAAIVYSRKAIDLFFEPLAQPLERSAILVADDALKPPTPLVETAGIVGEEQFRDRSGS